VVKVVNDGIKYKFEDVPPIAVSIPLAFQHTLAAFGSIIAIPLILGGALGLPAPEISFLVSAALVASGIGTILQSRGLGPIGARVPCVMGVSVKFLGPAIQVGTHYGLSGIFGSALSASFFEIFLSRFLRPLKKIFPPFVRGCIILLIGLTFIPEGIKWIGGSNKSIFLAITVIILILIFNRMGVGILSTGAIMFSIAAGYLLAIPLGLTAPLNLLEGGIVAFPSPFKYGMTFNLSAVLPFLVVYLVSAIETIGDLVAIEETCNEKIGFKRIGNGVLADGASSTLASALNSMPLTSFSQNIGIISLTGVASRSVVTITGIFFILLGLFPPIGILLSSIPEPVIGGATLVMVGMVAVAGIKILSKEELTNKKTLILAVSLSLGIGLSASPDVLASLPYTLEMLFSSGITTGCLSAIILNLVLPEKKGS
jgi:NCS2 family nucleobase:cation symporter-2